MRTPMIAGNWKMNTTVEEAVALVEEIKKKLGTIETVGVLVCPPFVSLHAVKAILDKTLIALGAQNLFYEEKGAYTGEISPLMLAELCDYVIIGHSERRQYFGETDEIVNRKIRAAQAAGITPILCVGEKLEENEAGKTEEVVSGQLKGSLERIEYNEELIIAYEPVWAIGTGKAATSREANDTIRLIRRTLAEMYGERESETTRILYGGSVNPSNITELMEQPEIDGGLVGGASLKADEFVSIITQTSQVYR